MKEKQCVVCGFDKYAENHHIIKRKDFGSDEEENLVKLCPNHHWIADFGTEEQRKEILNIIKNKTGKEGKEIEELEKDLLDKKIRVLEEECLCVITKEEKRPFGEEEWKKHKETSNYENRKRWFLGRGCTNLQCQLLHKRAEILILINKLKEELKTTDF